MFACPKSAISFIQTIFIGLKIVMGILNSMKILHIFLLTESHPVLKSIMAIALLHSIPIFSGV
jgi:hypothetical protein